MSEPKSRSSKGGGLQIAPEISGGGLRVADEAVVSREGGLRIDEELEYRLMAAAGSICALPHLRSASAVATFPYLMAARQSLCCIAASAVL